MGAGAAEGFLSAHAPAGAGVRVGLVVRQPGVDHLLLGPGPRAGIARVADHHPAVDHGADHHRAAGARGAVPRPPGRPAAATRAAAAKRLARQRTTANANIPKSRPGWLVRLTFLNQELILIIHDTNMHNQPILIRLKFLTAFCCTAS